jgi:hypothetical protein
MKLLSIACRMPHLADYLGSFHTVYHNTMVETVLPFTQAQFPARLILYRQDFFSLPPLDVDCVISHAAIHCFNDSRYGNTTAPDGWQKPYQAATKLRQIVGDRKVPAFVSVPVNHQEYFVDNNVHLSHDKFILSFERAGFTLQDHYFDYVSGGLTQTREYLDLSFRRSQELPKQTLPREYVVGNYHFS